MVAVLGALFSAFKSKVTELRRPERMLTCLGVRLDANSILFAVNCYAEALSHMWDPGHVYASRQLLCSKLGQ